MADVWTTPATWSSEVISDAKLNTHIRDNPTALFNGLVGDASADSDIKHRHLSGTLANRPSAGNAGRIYITTDTVEAFFDDGSNWYHLNGGGAFDDLIRANSTVISPSRSGHPWAEEAGAWKIDTNRLMLESASTAYATLNTNALLTRNYSLNTTVLTGGTVGTIDIAAVAKFNSTSNVLFVQLTGSAFQIVKILAGTATVMTTFAISPSANRTYGINVQVFGATIHAQIMDHATGGLNQIGTRDADILHANFAGAVKIGFRCLNTQDAATSIAISY